MVNGDENLIFFGTSGITVPFLNELRKNFKISCIVTQPDSYGGRKRKKIEPAAKHFARNNNIPYIQPEKFTESEVETIKNYSPKIGVAVSYGKFLPQKIFSIPDKNCINVHFSILPKYRGAAPVQRAIEQGDVKAGYSVFEIVRKMDAGPVWFRDQINIYPGERSDALLSRISVVAAKRLPSVIRQIFAGDIKKSLQNEKDATFAPALSRDEGRISWDESAGRIVNKFRAYYPWPGIFFFSGEKKIIVKEAESLEGNTDSKPGKLLELSKQKMVVTCGNRTMIKITAIHPQGKKIMTPFSYSLGNHFEDILS